MRFNYKYFLVIVVLSINVLTGQSWEFIGGPQGIFPNDVIFLNNGRVLCSTQKGVYISDDHGDNWRISESSQNYRGIFSLTERSNGEVIAVANFGIVKSTDKGESWEQISDISYLRDYGVRFRESPVDSSLYFVRDSMLYKSTDGGYNWNIIWESNGSNPIIGYQFIDDMMIDESGFIYLAVRYNNIFRSIDNGKTFKSFPIGYDLSNSIVSNIYSDKHGGLYFLIYNGSNLTVHFSNNKLIEINNRWPDFPLCVTSNGDLIYKSYNCINLYDFSKKESESVACPFFVKDQYANNIVTFGDIWIANFTVLGLYRSDNAGKTWKNINTSLGYKQCLSMYITDSGKMLASTFNAYFWGGLFNSTDEGKTWNQINPPEDPYFVEILKLKNGNLIGAGGSGFYVADKEGNNWTQTKQYDYASNLFISKNGTVYIGTIEDGMMISRDNGNTWSAVSSIVKSRFTAFGESNTGRKFAAGLYDTGTYYSDDDGKTWHHINSDILTYSSVRDFICRNDTMYAGTYSGLLFSTDNGLNWNFSGQYIGAITKFALLSNGDLLAAVSGEGILRNKKNTRTWESLGNELNNRSISNIYFDNYNRIYAVTDSGIFRNDQYVYPFIISPYYGAAKQGFNIQLQWNNVPSATTYEVQLSSDSLFNSVIKTLFAKENTIQTGSLIPDKTYFWRVKSTSTMFNDLLSDVGKFTTSPPFSFTQNYPSPFNSLTSINFYIPYTTNVSLRIYNILGELVANLIDKEMSEGPYIYKWNASNLSSGIYFLRLEAGDFMQVRKTILLK